MHTSANSFVVYFQSGARLAYLLDIDTSEKRYV